MAKLLLGAPVREEIKKDLISRLKKLHREPLLVIVQVGNRADSNTYIRNKIKFGEEVGIKVFLNKFEENIEEEKLIEEITKISKDGDVNGIIVQLPLPSNIDSGKVINSIPKNKDADGLTTSPPAPLLAKERGEENILLVTPATAKAVLSIFNYYGIPIKSKKIAVVGRSRLAGGPIAELLKSLGGEIETCDRSTQNIKEVCKNADIIISAAGQIGLIDKSFVKPGQVIIDVGINRITPLRSGPIPSSPLTLRGEPEKTQLVVDINSKPKIVGDVNFEEVEPIVEAITPVPGGIGPLTVACLFENLLDLVEK